jgi:integrase
MPARIPSYRLHRPSGRAVVTLAGKDHYLGKHGSPASRQEYDRLLAEYLATRARRTSSAEPPGDLTINELLMAYWDHACAYYQKDGAPTSEPETIRQALRPVRLLYGETAARDFGPLALKAVRQAMIDHKIMRRCHATDPKTGEKVVGERVLAHGLSRRHINKQVNRIKRVFAWAAENEMVPIGIYQALTTVTGLRKGRSGARERPPVGPVPDEVVERTLPLLSPTVRAMVRVQRMTGMRPQEVVLMRGADIDRADPDCWVYRPARHKAEHHERERLVYLGPQAQALLWPFLDVAGEGFLFSPRRAEERRRAEMRAKQARPGEPRGQSRPRAQSKRSPGDVYDGGSYRKAIRRACLKLEMPIWFPHQLRHSAASEFRRRYGLEVAQALLGHSELGVTQVYAEVDRNIARRVMTEIG